MQGIIFDIKRFAVHDGPGIRTTVFSKGCVLDCPWCQNPEGNELNVNLWYFQNKCIRCNSCLNLCPVDALSHKEKKDQPYIVIDRGKCTLCGACVENCPDRALVFDGTEIDSGQVVAEVLKDRIFYEESGGGVTISGGDPLYQYEFNLDILRRCKQKKIHTAIETCLYGKWEIVQKFIEFTDIFLVDMKIIDNDFFKENIGEDNQIIKQNFENLLKQGVPVIVRIPLIPEVTASEDNINSIADYLSKQDASVLVELINFNPLAAGKYRRMNKPYRFDVYKAPLPDQQIERYRRILRSKGIVISDDLSG